MADLHIQVCYATPAVQHLRNMLVAQGTTLQAAIEQSGILGVAPEIDLVNCRVGVYGKVKPLDAIVRERDRIEIYRALSADPKDSRRKRALRKDRNREPAAS